MKKLKSLWRLINAKYYAVLVADSDEEISWALEALRQADTKSKEKE